MNLEKIKLAFKTLNTYSGAITAVIAALSFFVAYLQATLFTHGQSDIANLIIQEVGIVPMWTGALVLVLSSAFQTGFLILLLHTRGEIWKVTGDVPGMVLYIIMWLTTPLLYLFTVVFTFAVSFIMKKYEEKHPRKQQEGALIKVSIWLLLLFLMLSIFSFPMLPPRFIELKNGEKMVVTKISTNNGDILVYNSKTKKVREIAKDQIVKEEICSVKDTWFSYTLNDNLDPNRRLLNMCPSV